MEELMVRYESRLRKMIAARMDSKLARRLDASDVVQETMARAIERLPEYVATRPMSFYPWLRQQAWARFVELYRFHVVAEKRSVRRDIAVPGLSDASVELLARGFAANVASPSGHAQQNELRKQVRDAIERLPEHYREVLVMRHLEQLSINEVAEILDIPIGTVKSRLFRGVDELQKILSSTFGGPIHD